MSFSTDSHRFEVTVDDIRPDTRAIYPTISFTLNFSHRSSTQFDVINSIFHFRISKTEYHYVGPLVLDSSIITLSGQRTVPVMSRLILDPYGLKKIEELRENGDIFFNVYCYATILDQQSKRYTCTSNFEGKIAKSDWVEKFLQAFKYKDVVLLEVPKLDFPELTKAAELLSDAWKKKSMGQFRDVLVDCRRALEFITAEVKNRRFVTENGMPDWSEFLGDEKLGEIIGTIIQKLSGFIAPGAHYGKVFNIEDADYALMMTHTIANYVLHKLSRIH